MTNRMPDLPDDVADFFALPPEDWTPPEPPDEDWFAAGSPSDMEPDFEALLTELASLDEGDSPEPDGLTVASSDAQRGLFDYAPEDVPFITVESDFADTPLEPGEYTPNNTWERYLAAIPADRNPDVAEQALIDRALALNVVDAAFVTVEYPDEAGYAVGCLEVSTDPASGNYSGRYLEIGQFQAASEADTAYHALQADVHNGGVPVYAVHDYAEFAAQDRGMPVAWHELDGEVLAPFLAGIETEPTTDDPLLAFDAEAVRVAIDTGEPEQAITVNEPSPAQHALSAIGIAALDFDPEHDSPPYYDPETDTAYWIGIFQPDMDDRDNCVASILSLGHNPESGAVEAQLAPCVTGDWDKTFQSSQHLLNIMERDGLDACFLAAESMAIATDQRDLWETSRSGTEEPTDIEQTAEFTRDNWDMDL